MNRVVITGIGMVTAVGSDVKSSWENIIAGKSGVRHIQSFDSSVLPTRIAAEATAFDPTKLLPAKECKRLSRFIQLSVTVANEALNEAKLVLSQTENARMGCIFGVGMGSTGDIEENTNRYASHGFKGVSPLGLPKILSNMAAGQIAIDHHFNGPCISISSACASSTQAIGEAYLYLKSGLADVMIAGGAEAAISPLSVALFSRMRALSQHNEDPETACRPFDKSRDGFVLGEGAAALVLETFEHASRRGANIIAELAGYGASCDGYHATAPAPDGRGARLAMSQAMLQGGLKPGEIDYINAHGTGTFLNDPIESKAIESVFNSSAKELLVSSTKASTGHCLGGAGAIEAGLTALAINKNLVPPTLNHTDPDPDCNLDYVPAEARKKEVRAALSNSFAFGGICASLALKKVA